MSNENANELAAARHQTLIRSEKKIIGLDTVTTMPREEAIEALNVHKRK